MSQTKIYYFGGNIRDHYHWRGITPDFLKERRFFEMSENLRRIKYDDIEETFLDVERRFEYKFLDPYTERNQRILNKLESRVHGFWYGNVQYADVRLPPVYCEKFNSELKERVRAYWDYRCFECGQPQNGKALQVHHVHYNKKACCDGSPRDLVPLCSSCHPKTNHNREYWESHFTDLLYMYDPIGKCFFNKDEMLAYGNVERKLHNAILDFGNFSDFLEIFNKDDEVLV